MKAINRIFQYLDNQKIPHTRFEKEIGLSNGYLNTQLKRNADLGEGVLNKIIDNCLHINPQWLLTGEGSMLKPVAGEEKKTTAEATSSPISPEYLDNYNYLLSELRKKDQLIEEMKATIEQLHEQLNQKLASPPARTGTDG